MKRLFAIVWFLVTILGAAFSQDMMVLGRVVDEKDLQPIPAVNVWIKGTSHGTETNAEGYFFLRVPFEKKRKLVLSSVGYKRKEVDLKDELDQWTEIKLKEETLLLDEIIVLPGENPALALMKRVRENKPLNDPEFSVNRQNDALVSTDFYLFNIKRKWLQRKFLRDAANSALEQSDSALVMPLYHLDEQQHVIVATDGSVQRKVLERNENSLQVLGNEAFQALLQNYVSEVNFYKNNIVLFGRSFVSPLANFGNVYYQYYLLDSLSVENSKRYVVRFRPKNSKDLAFKGDMVIDSLTAALVDIKAQMPSSANINFVNDVVLNHSFTKYGEQFLPSNDHDLITFRLQMNQKSRKKGVAAVYQHKGVYDNYAHGDSVAADSVLAFLPDSVRREMLHYQAKIDTLNNSKLQRFAAGVVDLFLHGYVHAWKFDIGPLVNFYRYNKFEGHRVGFGMRTGESMMKNFTVGGFFGYGHRNKHWNYGGEFQARFGEKYRHRIGLFYSDNVEEYGTQKYVDYLDENMVGDVYNIFSSVGWNFDEEFARHQRYEVSYRYEEDRFALTSRAKYEVLYSNNYVPFTQQGRSVDCVNVGSLTLASRVAFKQRYLDGFFHRYYLYNTLPVVHLQLEYGHYSLNRQRISQGDYFKCVLFLRHAFPLLGGKFKYHVELGHVAGQVPWTLLDITRAGSGLMISDTRFCFMRPMEFISDTYANAGFTYFTKGFLFNWIPWVKKFNLREVVSFNCAAGGVLNPRHAEVLDFPSVYSGSNLNIPYIEMSVGIANIVRLLAVESVWRVTHRDNPAAAKWGVRLRLNFDF